LWIRCADEKQSVLARHLERIVVTVGCTLDSRTLLMLDDKRIPVVIIDPRKSNATWCGGWHHGNTARRIAQYAIAQDAVLCTKLAKKLVKMKIMQQKRLLHNVMSSYPEKRRPLFAGHSRLAALISSIEDSSIDEIRGLEGAGSRSYFAAYCLLYPERLHFTGRNRRPPRDPVNACLSLAYTLLMAEALQALYACGLDPSLGFYHLPAYGRPSLACDLIEIARVQADRRVLDMFRARLLDIQHFSERDGGVFLDKEGRSRFYGYWEAHAWGIRHTLRKTATAWANWVSDYSE